MALDKDRLGEALAAIAASPDASPAEIDAAKAKWVTIADKIITEYTDNAEISCTIPSTSINTTGSAAAQVGPPAPVNISGTIE